MSRAAIATTSGTVDAAAASMSRLELILQQIDSLPTLSSVATRVLALSGSSESDVREIVRLIESDPALTVKLLSLCRRAERGLGGSITTVERAVVMRGMDAVRAAMLS
ncbi:MAG TPA: HDOD domain-containing protein, partial [Phycisphaerales bacterium]|nr:HDOD domain-containing protein [Phycisphaerales bacterium]